jgi:hypothetical protein
MATTILGLSGAQYSVETAETGINCESYEVRYFPEVNEKLAGIAGETIARAVSAKLSREFTIQGEVIGSSGVMAFATGVACVPSGDKSTFGDGTGSILFDEATETQARGSWRGVNIRLSSDPGLVLA